MSGDLDHEELEPAPVLYGYGLKFTEVADYLVEVSAQQCSMILPLTLDQIRSTGAIRGIDRLEFDAKTDAFLREAIGRLAVLAKSEFMLGDAPELSG